MRALALLTLLLGGCTWVSSGDLDCQLMFADDDGDGYPLNELEAGYEGNDRCNHLVPVDCNDADANIHPDAEDAWYDGVDGDCAGDDDYDQDLDGYVADEHVGLATAGAPGTGELPGGDCDDGAISVYPGSSDLFYDGIDTDCAGDDDYDQDGDGYVPTEYVGLTTTYVDGTGELPGGDCDDTELEVNPAQTDAWYDGVDSDCSGQDDYDQDGDGYVPDDYLGLATTYVDGSGVLPAGDCNDLDASIHAGARDEWYDGIDSDCLGDDDYDQDLDGHQDAATAKDGDDCDDRDATSYPGAGEIFGDVADHDCDGGAQTFALADLAEMSFEAPQSLVFQATDSLVYLALSAEELGVAGTSLYDSALAVAWDSSDPGAGYTDTITWIRNFSDPGTQVLTPGYDVLYTDSTLYGATGMETGTTRQMVVRSWDIASDTSGQASPPTIAPLSFDDMSIVRDANDSVVVVGCTQQEHDEAFAFLWAQSSVLDSNSYNDTFTTPTRASTCDLDFFASSGMGTLVMSEIRGVVSGGGDTGDTGDTGGADTGGADTGGTDTGGTDTGGTDTGGTDTGVTPPPPAGPVTGFTTVDTPYLTVHTFDAPQAGVAISFQERAVFEDYAPSSVQVFDSGPARLLVLAEPEANLLSVLELSNTWALSDVYTVRYRGGQLLEASSVLAPDGTIYLLAIDDAGALTLYHGLPGTDLTMQEVGFDQDFPVDEAAIWVDGTGDHLYIAASGFDVTTSADRVVFGYASLGGAGGPP